MFQTSIPKLLLCIRVLKNDTYKILYFTFFFSKHIPQMYSGRVVKWIDHEKMLPAYTLFQNGRHCNIYFSLNFKFKKKATQAHLRRSDQGKVNITLIENARYGPKNRYRNIFIRVLLLLLFFNRRYSLALLTLLLKLHFPK